jgi:hypothetical protein
MDSFPQDRVCYLPVDEPHETGDDIGETNTSLDRLRWLLHPRPASQA